MGIQTDLRILLEEEISDDVRWVSDEDGANWSIRNMGDASDLLTTSVPVIQPDPISAADVISGVMKLPDSTAPHNDWGSSLFNGMDDEFVESGGKEVFLIPGNENSINGLIQSELGLSNELDDSFYAISGIDDSSSVSTSQNRFVPSTLGVQFGLAEMSNLFLTSMVPSANDILGGSSNALSLDHRYKLHGDGDWLGEVGVDYAMAGSDEIIDSTYKHRLFDPSDVNSLLSSLGSYLAYKGIDHLNIIPRSIGDKEIDLTKVYSDGTDVLIPMTIPAYQPATGSGSAAAPGFREVGFYSQDPTGTTDGQGSTSQSVMQRLFNDDWSGYSMRRTLGDVYDGSGASAMVLRLGPQGDADPDAGAGFRYIVTDDDYNFEGWQNMSSDYYVRKGITDDAEKRAEYNRLNMSGRHDLEDNQIRVDPVTENMSYSEYDYVGYNDRKDGILIPESDRFEFEEFLMGDEDGEWGGVATDGVLNGRIDFNDDVEGLLEYAEAHFFDVMSNIFPVYEASMKWQDHAFENLYDQSAGVETFDEWRIGAEEDGLISPIPDATDDRIADRDSLEEWEESATAAYYGYLAESGVSTNENVLTDIWFPGGYHAGGIVGYQAGGHIEGDGSMANGMNEMMGIGEEELLLEAAMAIMDPSYPNREMIIQQAVQMFGIDTVRQVAEMLNASGGMGGSPSPGMGAIPPVTPPPPSVPRPTAPPAMPTQPSVGPVMGMAGGGYVPGNGGGMSDGIAAVTDGVQPAALSSGEFVVPADVVSHLGDGNNQNGATQLHDMMNRIRSFKTGRVSQPPSLIGSNIYS